MNTSNLIYAILFMMGLWLNVPARATSYAYANPQQLAARSDAVVSGTLTTIQQEATGRYVTFDFSVDEVVSGTLSGKTRVRIVYHRIMRVPNAKFRDGDRMLLILKRFDPQEWPYRAFPNLSDTDYKIAGGDSEGGFFFRDGKIAPIHGGSLNNSRGAPLDSEKAFVRWLLGDPSHGIPGSSNP